MKEFISRRWRRVGRLHTRCDNAGRWERDVTIGRRPGFTLMEVTIAAAIVASLLAVVGQMVVLVNVAHRAAEQQMVALEAADNLLEHVANLPWDSITPQADFASVLPKELVISLPVAKWDVTVSQPDAGRFAKRVSVAVFRVGDGKFGGPIRLTTWVYPPTEMAL